MVEWLRRAIAILHIVHNSKGSHSMGKALTFVVIAEKAITFLGLQSKTRLSTVDISEGTGLSASHVSRALNLAADKGKVIKIKGTCTEMRGAQEWELPGASESANRVATAASDVGIELGTARLHDHIAPGAAHVE